MNQRELHRRERVPPAIPSAKLVSSASRWLNRRRARTTKTCARLRPSFWTGMRRCRCLAQAIIA